jgi:hypothetical protein
MAGWAAPSLTRVRVATALAAIPILLAVGCGSGELASGRFVRLGAPAGSASVVSDLLSHDGRLYGVASTDPLGGGRAVAFATDDGSSFESLLPADGSEGLLRIRALEGRLWLPDGDPPGREAGRVFELGPDAAIHAGRIPGALHTYDVALHGGEILASSGMRGARGALHRFVTSGADWEETASAPASRLKELVVFRERLFAAKRREGSPHDYLRWLEAPARGAGEEVDAVSGEAVTVRWYASSRGRLFWSLHSEGRFQLRASDDGERWVEIPGFGGVFVSDFAERGDVLYALAETGLFASRDHERFAPVASPPEPGTFAPRLAAAGRANADASASLAVHRGALYAGSSTDGHLYRVDGS